jgi:biotin carboxylase
MNKDTFLVVGAGYGQLPAISASQAMGFKVITVDRDPTAPGMALADIALPVDILDEETIVTIACEHGVIGALTMQSDIGTTAVGAVVDALGLSGCGRSVAERCSNKILTRKAFARHGVPQPRFAIAGSVDEAAEAAGQIGFPCVIKSPDSSGSRGIVRVNNIDEVSNAFLETRRFTRGDLVLVEEFITGREIGAQAFCVDGRCCMILIHDDELSKPPFMIPVAHAFPSTLTLNQQAKTESAISVCLEALGIVEGPSNIDLIIDSDGNTKIIEIGARIGATCLPELVKHHTGIDWTRAAVEIACGLKPNLKLIRNQSCAAFILESDEDGVMLRYDLPDNWSRHPDILEWEVTAKSGDVVSRLRKGTDRIGKVITRGVTTQAAMDLARDFRDAFQIQVTDDTDKIANG